MGLLKCLIFYQAAIGYSDNKTAAGKITGGFLFRFYLFQTGMNKHRALERYQ